MVREIVQNGHPALRTHAEEIPVNKIRSKEVQKLLEDMHDTLATQADGVALAAPQIGIRKQIFVVAPFVFEKSNIKKLVYINPRIVSLGKEHSWKTEGCLSCRWQIGEVDRHEEVEIEAYDENGKKFRIRAKGLLAHIFQHETDHLNGILFLDKAKNVRELSEEEIEEIKNAGKENDNC